MSSKTVDNFILLGIAPEGMQIPETPVPQTPEKLHEALAPIPERRKKKKPKEAKIGPKFEEELQPITTMDGQMITFTCKVTGKPRPEVTWYRNGKLIEENKDVSITYLEDGTCTLAINETFPEDSGDYTCKAVNAAGEVSTTAPLVVDCKCLCITTANVTITSN